MSDATRKRNPDEPKRRSRCLAVSVVGKRPEWPTYLRKRVIGTVEESLDESAVRRAASGLLSDVDLRFGQARVGFITMDQLVSILSNARCVPAPAYRASLRRRPTPGIYADGSSHAGDVALWTRSRQSKSRHGCGASISRAVRGPRSAMSFRFCLIMHVDANCSIATPFDSFARVRGAVAPRTCSQVLKFRRWSRSYPFVSARWFCWPRLRG